MRGRAVDEIDGPLLDVLRLGVYQLLRTRVEAHAAVWTRRRSRRSPHQQDTIARLRRHLADDLDTPKALAAVDNWAQQALDYGGPDHSAPTAITTAIDALLGIRL